VWRLLRRRVRGRLAPWEAGALGHVYSAFPDVLFLTFGVLHVYWMDVFALHISLHFVPRPLLTQLVLFALSLVAYTLSADQQRRPSYAALGGVAVVLGIAMLMRYPVPDTLADLRDRPRLAWMCPLAEVPLSSGQPGASHHA
jgi:hypothetical protein